MCLVFTIIKCNSYANSLIFKYGHIYGVFRLFRALKVVILQHYCNALLQKCNSLLPVLFPKKLQDKKQMHPYNTWKHLRSIGVR